MNCDLNIERQTRQRLTFIGGGLRGKISLPQSEVLKFYHGLRLKVKHIRVQCVNQRVNARERKVV